MPTINQLVNQSRKDKVKKDKTPHLAESFNSIKKETISVFSPQKKGVCTDRKSVV